MAVVVFVRVLLAGTFAFAGVAKALDMRGSRHSVAAFGVPAWLANPIGTLLPWAELAIAFILLVAPTALWGAALASLLLGVFTIVITVNLALGRTPDCHCF